MLSTAPAERGSRLEPILREIVRWGWRGHPGRFWGYARGGRVQHLARRELRRELGQKDTAFPLL